MAVERSGYGCPVCKNAGAKNEIVANGGKLVCSFNPAHVWMDTGEFLSLKPTLDFKVSLPVFAPQEGHGPMSLTVPLKLKEKLEEKLGDRLSATVVDVLWQVLEGDVLTINETDLTRLSGHLGKTPTNSGELVGMVYSLAEEVKTAKEMAENSAKDLAAYQGLAPGRVVVNLGEQFQNAVDKARDAQLPLAVWVERSMRMGLESSWF